MLYFNCVAIEYFLYGWFSFKDVLIKFKNGLLILELTVKLNGGLINITSVFVFYFFLIEWSCFILNYHCNWLKLMLFDIHFLYCLKILHCYKV